MKCTPLTASFGARLHLELDAPLPADAFRALFHEHELLLIRGQEISAEQQRELLACLGRIEPNPDGTPMEMEVTNQHDQTTAPEGELVFHYDYAYDPEPISVIGMYGQVVRGDVTPTCFASSSRVLDRIPGELLDRLRDLQASNACFLSPYDAPGERAERPEPLIPRGEPGWGPAHYWADHPVIWHNALGVETLFVCLQHTERILGIPRDESDTLLETLYGYLYDPVHVYEHVWEPHDLLIWDNLTVQHARPEPRPGPRTLRRYHVSKTDLTFDYVRKARELGIM